MLTVLRDLPLRYVRILFRSHSGEFLACQLAFSSKRKNDIDLMTETRFYHRNSAGAGRTTKSKDNIGFVKEAFTYDICRDRVTQYE